MWIGKAKRLKRKNCCFYQDERIDNMMFGKTFLHDVDVNAIINDVFEKNEEEIKLHHRNIVPN